LFISIVRRIKPNKISVYPSKVIDLGKSNLFTVSVQQHHFSNKRKKKRQVLCLVLEGLKRHRQYDLPHHCSCFSLFCVVFFIRFYFHSNIADPKPTSTTPLTGLPQREA
jgi:hypothetical protein